MVAHRFTLQLGGEMIYGVVFHSEEELEQFCAAQGVDLNALHSPAPPAATVGDEPRPRGRPSFYSAITAAVAELEPQLASCGTISDRARLVLRYMARSLAPSKLPSLRTLTVYLANWGVGRKVGEKYGRKSKRAKIRSKGGDKCSIGS